MTHLTHDLSAQERDTVAVAPFRDADDFADVHGLSIECALQLIDELGNDRSKLDEAAFKLKAKLASH